MSKKNVVRNPTGPPDGAGRMDYPRWILQGAHEWWTRFDGQVYLVRYFAVPFPPSAKTSSTWVIALERWDARAYRWKHLYSERVPAIPSDQPLPDASIPQEIVDRWKTNFEAQLTLALL